MCVKGEKTKVPRPEGRLTKKDLSDEFLFGWALQYELGVCQLEKRGKAFQAYAKE